MANSARRPPKRGRHTRGSWTPGLFLGVGVVLTSDRLLFKTEFVGQDNIPAEGPAIVVMNHISVLDPLLCSTFVWKAGRTPVFLVKDSLFKIPVFGKLLASAKQIGVSRGTMRANTSLDLAVAALRSGEVVCVYPEGTVTRDPDFWPMQAKTGAARLASACPDVPVIPVAQWGAQKSLNYHTHERDLFPRKRARLTAGPPLDLGAMRTQTSPEGMRVVTAQIMTSIRDMLGALRGQTPPEEFFTPAKKADHG